MRLSDIKLGCSSRETNPLSLSPVQVIAIAGCLADDYQVVYEHGLDDVFSIAPGPLKLQEALEAGGENLTTLSTNIATVLAMRLN